MRSAPFLFLLQEMGNKSGLFLLFFSLSPRFSFSHILQRKNSDGGDGMEYYRVTGGRRLVGRVRVRGSKNAALPILFASLLFHEPVLVQNVPDIADVRQAILLLRAYGARVEHLRNTVYIDAREAVPRHGVMGGERLRAGIYLLGALLGRFGEAELSLPGGCNFGIRPINYHLMAMEKMGALITEEGDRLLAVAGKLHGNVIDLPRPSVGATVNAILAAVTAEGETVIHGAAREPHIVDLIRFLNAGGGKISGAGEMDLRIVGVPRLSAVSHTLIPDSIEAGTYLFMGAATGGDLCVGGLDNSEIDNISLLLMRMGATVSYRQGDVRVRADHRLLGISAEATPFPGFPTDLQPILAAACLTAKGSSAITERVWQERFQYLLPLSSFGGECGVFGSTAVISGGRLTGRTVRATDLRGGAALLLAALAAKGESHILSAELIRRGYEAPEKVLRSLGASVDWVKDSNDLP